MSTNEKTPDEIKKGLECCIVYCKLDNGCPYIENMECSPDLKADALAYIQHLEADNAQQARCIENLTDKLNATNDALPRWISVEERLPEEPCAVLVVVFGNAVCVAWYSIGWFETGSGLHFSAGNGVTHWMPLPEPPVEE